jgi:hypothetical protein
MFSAYFIQGGERRDLPFGRGESQFLSALHLPWVLVSEAIAALLTGHKCSHSIMNPVAYTDGSSAQ